MAAWHQAAGEMKGRNGGMWRNGNISWHHGGVIGSGVWRMAAWRRNGAAGGIWLPHAIMAASAKAQRRVAAWRNRAWRQRKSGVMIAAVMAMAP